MVENLLENLCVIFFCFLGFSGGFVRVQAELGSKRADPVAGQRASETSLRWRQLYLPALALEC
jgi:hypothetical protein